MREEISKTNDNLRPTFCTTLIQVVRYQRCHIYTFDWENNTLNVTLYLYTTPKNVWKTTKRMSFEVFCIIRGNLFFHLPSKYVYVLSTS